MVGTQKCQNMFFNLEGLLVRVLQRNRASRKYIVIVYKYTYKKVYLLQKGYLWRIGLHDYGGWEVLCSTAYKMEIQETWWYNSLLVRRPENQESWWYKSQSKDQKGGEMAQLK